MDEELEDFAQQYAHRRNIILGDRLGFGIRGTVFAAADNKKPGFFAVKFHREDRPFERECRVYERLSEERLTQILGFNVPQLLMINSEFRAIEMTIVRNHSFLILPTLTSIKVLSSAKTSCDSGKKIRLNNLAKDGLRLTGYSQRCTVSVFTSVILIPATSALPKRVTEQSKSRGQSTAR